MKIKQIRESTNLSQSQFSKKTKIPIKTLQKWEQGIRNPPEYVIKLIEYFIENELKKDG